VPQQLIEFTIVELQAQKLSPYRRPLSEL